MAGASTDAPVRGEHQVENADAQMRQRTDYNTAVHSHQSRPITDSCSVAPLPVSRLSHDDKVAMGRRIG